MAKSKIDIIYDMVNLAYDVKRQCGRDKTLNYYIGDYARDVIKAKDEKVYDEFIYLAKQLEAEGWEEFIDWSKNLIKEYNQIEESKKSSRKSIKESSVRCVTFEQIVDSRFDDISKGEKILNDRKDEIIELCGDDFSVYTNKIRFYDWDDGTNQYRQKYYVRKNNNKVTWNDLYKIVNSVKAVPYDFKKVNDTLFESRKSIKESKDSYKVKVLNEMLDAMAKDEYNIPKVGIYGVTKNINLDIGAIQLLIDYYK